MAKSMFQELIKKYFKANAKYFYDKINGSKEEPKYLHDEMLDEEFSDDMTYESISGDFTRVTTDIVAFDSPAPPKTRASLKVASGNIPKMAIKFLLDEKQMNTLINLSYRPGRQNELVKKIFNDTESAIYGIKERIEQAHLLGFSGGVALIQNDTNTGTGIRLTYDIPESNKFGVVAPWSNPDAKPVDDIKRVLNQAKVKGEYPNTIWMEIHVFKDIENSLEIRYKNTKNTDVLYSTGIEYLIRIPYDLNSGKDVNSSENHKTDDKVLLLDSSIYESNNFKFEPLTKELWRKLRIALSHDIVFIDGVGYVKEEDFETEGPLGQTNLYVLSVTMTKNGQIYSTKKSNDNIIIGTEEIPEIIGFIENTDNGFIQY